MQNFLRCPYLLYIIAILYCHGIVHLIQWDNYKREIRLGGGGGGGGGAMADCTEAI